MKYSTLTYYLLTIICLLSVSCTQTELIDDAEIGAESVNVQLTINFPASTRGGTVTTDDGTEYERYINDVRIFAFVDEKFVEEARNVIPDANEGLSKRTIYATLTKSYYTSGQQIKLVALVNTRARGVNNISIESGNSKSVLYSQLIFDYNPNDWSLKYTKQYIPMWGEAIITTSTTASQQLQLKRAIAKVGITVGGGQGIKDFQIKKVTLVNYNNKGYCAPKDGNAYATLPYIPNGTSQIEKPITFNLTAEEGRYAFEDRIYIPEQNNITADNDPNLKKLYLLIDATIGTSSIIYTIEFKKKDEYNILRDHDILRNYSYILNIRTVTPDSNVGIDYEIKEWENIEIDVPEFGNK